MSITLVIFSILGLFVIILIIMNIRLEMRINKLFMGTDAKGLEGVIHKIGHHAEQLEKTQKEINSHLEEVDSKLKKTIRNVETIRFNPFPDAGSNQSSAISMINDDGDGVVLSSLYARDRMSVFAKPISKGTPLHELTSEEEEVLEKSKKKHGKK